MNRKTTRNRKPKRYSVAERAREARAALRQMKRLTPEKFPEWHEWMIAAAALKAAQTRHESAKQRWLELGAEPARGRRNR